MPQMPWEHNSGGRISATQERLLGRGVQSDRFPLERRTLFFVALNEQVSPGYSTNQSRQQQAQNPTCVCIGRERHPRINFDCGARMLLFQDATSFCLFTQEQQARAGSRATR